MCTLAVEETDECIVYNEKFMKLLKMESEIKA